MRAQTVVVTGCSGRIGQAAVARITAAGHSIVGVDSVTPGPVTAHRLTRFEQGCLEEPGFAARIFAGADCVVHLAAVPDDAPFNGALLPANILGLHCVLEAVRTQGVRRLLVASTGKLHVGSRVDAEPHSFPLGTSITPRPRCLYAATKAFAEAATEAYAFQDGSHLQAVCVRFGWCPRTVEDVRAMEECAEPGQGKDEYLSPHDAGGLTLKFVEACLPASFRYSLLFCQSKPPQGGVPRFDLAPARDLLGFSPESVWPQGLGDIEGDSAYRNHPLLFPRIGGRAWGQQAEGALNSELENELASAEILLRLELACAYRAFALLGWEHSIHTHLTVKLPGYAEGEERFLINPYGLHWDEITAGSLVVVSANGDIVDHGSIGHDSLINPAGFKIHSALHTSARGRNGGDIVWTMHTHYRSTVAVSCTECGVLPLSTFANDLGEVRYHNFAHATANDEVCQRLVDDLGPESKVLLLRNHGDITVGRTCAEAWFLMYNLHRATDVQVDAFACSGGAPVIQPLAEALEENYRIVRNNYTGKSFGELEWAAMKRRVRQRMGDGYMTPFFVNRSNVSDLCEPATKLARL